MLPYSDMAALIQSENHAANKGKTTGRYQFDTHSTGIGLSFGIFVNRSIPKKSNSNSPLQTILQSELAILDIWHCNCNMIVALQFYPM